MKLYGWRSHNNESVARHIELERRIGANTTTYFYNQLFNACSICGLNVVGSPPAECA